MTTSTQDSSPLKEPTSVVVTRKASWRRRLRKLARNVELGLVLAGLRSTDFWASELTTAPQIREARLLATGVFTHLGKIQPADVDPATGLLVNDALLGRSVFFGVHQGLGGRLVATARLVWEPSLTIDETRMPMAQLTPEVAAMLRDLPAGSMAEFSSLAKLPGTGNVPAVQLLREMVRFAHAKGIRYFTCGLEPHVCRRYEAYFGGTAVRLATTHVVFPGIVGNQMPYLFSIGHGISDASAIQRGRRLSNPLPAMLVRRYFEHS